MSRSDAAQDILREVFGYSGFRGGQAEAIDALLAGRDAVVLLPTGAGKSLCYQVPALVERRCGGGTTIVVSPLIALMKDQVEALQGRGIAAAAINSHQEDDEQRDVVRTFLQGGLDLLYVSPERAVMDSFKRMLQRVPIALLAIDEAHCLSQWGHDFRPEYMRLIEVSELLEVPTIALTATATPRVLDEIVKQLGLQDPATVCGDFRRPNLRFSVQHLRTDVSRLESLVQALDAIGLRPRSGAGRAIVYCSTRKKTESVSKHLKSLGFASGHYHAGRTKLARERAQRAFDLARTRILVATNAFGMGIDYADVRLIVHFSAPGSLEAYYQEAGRAGRDGIDSECRLFFGAADLMTQRRIQGSGGSAAVQRHQETSLAAVEAYARSSICRQQTLCAHFTERDDHPACGLCDVCTSDSTHWDQDSSDAAQPERVVEPLSADAKATILEAVGHLARPVGKSTLAKALRGSRAKNVKKNGLLELPEHGRLKAVSEASIVHEMEQMLDAGTLARRGQKYPTIWLPGRPVRPARTPGTASKRSPSSRPRHTEIARALENYRKRTARSLRWKPYMVFQRRVITAIEKQRPETLEDLARIPGLGASKIDRFGRDILDMVRRHND